MFKMLREEKRIKSVFYSYSRTNEKTSGFRLSGALWALSIFSIIPCLLDAVASWSKMIISSLQRLDWGFYQHGEIPQWAITNYLPCSSYTRVSPGVGNSVPFILEPVSMGGGFAFLSLFFCSRATRPSAFICIIPPPFHVWFPLKVKQIHFKPRHVLKHSGRFFKGTWYICFQKVVVKIYWLCLQMSLKCGVSEKLCS